MSRSRNVRLIETWYYRMWNRWDKSAFEEILTPDIAFRLARASEAGLRRTLRVHGLHPHGLPRLHESY
jgi:hypothetical protein